MPFAQAVRQGRLIEMAQKSAAADVGAVFVRIDRYVG